VSEAFEASYLFMTEFAGYVALVLGVIATISPILAGLASALGKAGQWATKLVTMPGTRRGRGEVELPPATLHASLGIRGFDFAQDTRGLIESLGHARRVRRHWEESGPQIRCGWWRTWMDAGRDSDFVSTIGATAEVWTWLNSAEAYADQEGFAGREVQEVAALVRRRLFDEGELAERLDDILAALLRLDGEFWISETSPYRGGPTPPSASRAHPPGCEAQDEDEDASTRRWEGLRREHGALLRSVAARYVRDPDRRRDLEQEIDLAVWKALPRFRGEASLKTYAMRIAHYCAARFRRREPRFVATSDALEGALFVHDARAPEDELISSRRRERLREAIAELPEAQREALLLQLQGVSYRDIARRLEISESNASVRISRARKALHRKLAVA
jgi:RNA polymerase sigma factor (sigma-70 family)